MKIYAPKYYKTFKCIADKCRHSCCVGWEIDVDSTSLERYRALDCIYGKEILKSIDCTDTPHFVLSENERCPHLDERGLCRIITNVGEDCLCDICREHPRFYNFSPMGKLAGLGLSCEEAARIILLSDDYAELVLIGETEGEDDAPEFDALPYIEKLFSILSDRTVEYRERLARILEAGGFSEPLLTDTRARELFESLEYLDVSNKELFANYKSVTRKPEFDKMLERALAYFIYRHLPKAYDEEELFAYLGFCLVCEELLSFLASGEDVKSAEDFCNIARTVSEELEYSEDNTYLISSEFI